MRVKWLRTVGGPVLALVATVAVLGIAATRVDGAELSGAFLSVGRPVWLALAAVALLVFLAADAASLSVLARALSPRVSRLAAAGVVLESKMVEGATSFGGLEFPFQVVRLRRLGLDAPQASSAVVIRGMVHVSLLVLLALLALVPGVPSPVTDWQRLLLLVVVGALAAAWLALWAVFGRSRGFSLLPRVVAARLQEFGEGLRTLRTTGIGVFVGVVGLQALAWAGTFALAPCILLSLGWTGPLLPLVLGQILLPIFTSFSPLPGGAGMAEVGYLQVLGGAAAPEVALASLILWRLCTWVAPTLVGAAVFGVRQVGSRL
jgi:uncharacterized protein (TIRG00374 family)